MFVVYTAAKSSGKLMQSCGGNKTGTEYKLNTYEWYIHFTKVECCQLKWRIGHDWKFQLSFTNVMVVTAYLLEWSLVTEWNGMDQPPHPNGITVICGDDSNLLPCRLCSRWWNFGFNVTTSNIFHFLYLFGLNLIDKEFTIIDKSWPCFPRASLFFRASWNFSASESICLFLAAVL